MAENDGSWRRLTTASRRQALRHQAKRERTLKKSNTLHSERLEGWQKELFEDCRCKAQTGQLI